MIASDLRWAAGSVGLVEPQTGGSFGQDSPLLAGSLFSWSYMIGDRNTEF